MWLREFIMFGKLQKLSRWFLNLFQSPICKVSGLPSLTSYPLLETFVSLAEVPPTMRCRWEKPSNGPRSVFQQLLPTLPPTGSSVNKPMSPPSVLAWGRMKMQKVVKGSLVWRDLLWSEHMFLSPLFRVCTFPLIHTPLLNCSKISSQLTVNLCHAWHQFTAVPSPGSLCCF